VCPAGKEKPLAWKGCLVINAMVDKTLASLREHLGMARVLERKQDSQ